MFVSVDKSLRADHLGIDERTAHLFGKKSARRIGDACHRCEDERIVECDIADLHLTYSVRRSV